MKTVFPWFLVIGLSAGLGALFVSGRTKDAELSKLREESGQAAATHTELEEAKNQIVAQQQEIGDLRKETSELLRLRNEVGQLRADKQKLSAEVQSVKADADRVKSQAGQALLNAQAKGTELANLQNEVRTAQAQQGAQRSGCINHLRQLDGAKQQWALEHNKTPDSIPTPQELMPYFKDNTLPVCPAGGTYLINSLSQAPTCSLPGHALPK